MIRDAKIFLEDVLEQIKLIEESIDNKSKLSKDLNLRDATVRRLEIIGEAIKNISLSFRQKYPNIKWKNIAGTRDIMIHAYFRVDLDVVWKIVNKDLPILKKQIKEILEKEFKEK